MKQPEKPVNNNGFNHRYHEYHERYMNWKHKGESWYPFTLYEDAVVAGLILVLLFALIIYAGVPMEAQADPTNSSYVPRPEWYFMFLFQLLKYFPGELEWVGVVIVPSIALIVILLLPWLDRGRQRVITRRPLTGILTVAALVGITFLTLQAFQGTPASASAGRKLSPVEAAGEKLFEKQNCKACHSLGGQGGKNAPALDGVGSRRDIAYIHRYIENPKQVNPNATMPPFLPPLTHQEVEDIAVYLGGFK